jgi:hypothetical protein
VQQNEPRSERLLGTGHLGYIPENAGVLVPVPAAAGAKTPAVGDQKLLLLALLTIILVFS